MSNVQVPAVNIPPKVRFILYVSGVLIGQTASYLALKHVFGGPEVALSSNIVSLLLTLAAAKTDTSKPEVSPPAVVPVRVPAGLAPTTYTVQPGDTLASIAETTGVKASVLRNLNRAEIDAHGSVAPGMQLRLS